MKTKDIETEKPINDSRSRFKGKLTQERIKDYDEDLSELGIHIKHSNRRA